MLSKLIAGVLLWVVAFSALHALGGELGERRQVVPSLPDPSVICRELVAGVHETLTGYLGQNVDEYVALKKRVLYDPAVSAKDFDAIFMRLVLTVSFFDQRLRQSRHIDGNHALAHFLQGVVIWAESYSDLVMAIDVFYHQEPRFEHPSKAKPDNDWDLEYFAARMCWVVDRYDGENRDKVLRNLDRFDETNATENHIVYNHETGRVTIDKSGPAVWERLAAMGIRIPKDPVTPLGLRFNNDRRLVLFKFREADVWAARELQSAEPSEHFLGVGDQSVRQFFRLFRMTEGFMDRHPFAADFFSVYEHKRQPGKWLAKIREMKFSHPRSHFIEIEKAIAQLSSTWMGLDDAFNGELSVGSLEIVLPARHPDRKGELGAGYTIGRRVNHPEAEHEINELLLSGRPVNLTFHGQSRQVLVRQIPISSVQFDRIRDEDDKNDR